jgi:hypothetical protein
MVEQFRDLMDIIIHCFAVHIVSAVIRLSNVVEINAKSR